MVKVFVAGLCLGFPLGCYLREQGYHKRIQGAYRVLRPGKGTMAMDEYRDTAAEYYKDLQAGRANEKDFEKHIYGQFGAKAYHKDDDDRMSDKTYKEKKLLENEVKAYVRKQQ